MRLFLSICLVFCAKTVFAQSTIDSILLKFINDFDSKVKSIEYKNPKNKDSIYSKIYNEYLDFGGESPNYYGEAKIDNEYQIQKCCLGNISNIELVLYKIKEYDSIQFSFLLKENKIEGTTVILFSENKDATIICYDRRFILSKDKFWIKRGSSKRTQISKGEFEERIKNLLE